MVFILVKYQESFSRDLAQTDLGLVNSITLFIHVIVSWIWCFCLFFPLEHGQKFPGLRPADAAGLHGSQQKRAEAGPGGPSFEAGADRVQPRAAEERQAALWVAFPQNIQLAGGTASWGRSSCVLIPQLLPDYHLSGGRLPQRHFKTACSRGQAGATALLPNVGDTASTNRAKWVFSTKLYLHILCWIIELYIELFLWCICLQLLRTVRNCKTVSASLS